MYHSAEGQLDSRSSPHVLLRACKGAQIQKRVMLKAVIPPLRNLQSLWFRVVGLRFRLRVQVLRFRVGGYRRTHGFFQAQTLMSHVFNALEAGLI